MTLQEILQTAVAEWEAAKARYEAAVADENKKDEIAHCEREVFVCEMWVKRTESLIGLIRARTSKDCGAS